MKWKDAFIETILIMVEDHTFLALIVFGGTVYLIGWCLNWLFKFFI